MQGREVDEKAHPASFIFPYVNTLAIMKEGDVDHSYVPDQAGLKEKKTSVVVLKGKKDKPQTGRFIPN